MSDLSNQLAVITGAASGIGEAIARRFASDGARVIILDRDEAAARSVAAGIGPAASARSLDVSDHAAVAGAFRELITDHGVPGILVTNAGNAHIGTLETTSPGDFERLFAINVRGVYNCMHAAIRPMADNGGGVILNMASCAAKIAIPDRFAYSMTKAAVMNMSLTVARDYVDKKIRCNCLCPARVHTPFVDNYIAANYPGREEEMFAKLSATQPIGRMAEPSEIADLAAFLCSGSAAFITGSAIDIDGGFTLLR